MRSIPSKIEGAAAGGLFLAFILAAAPAAAQTLTLGKAREAAIAASQDVAQAEIKLRSLGYGKDEALAAFLPSVSASAGISGSVADDGSVSTAPSVGVSASQTLFSGLSRLASWRSATAAAEKGVQALRAARLAVIEEADARFLDALETARNAETAKANLEAAERSLELARAKREVGALAEGDYLEAQSSWAAKRTAEVQARYAAAASARKLAAYTGSSAAPAPLDDGEILALASFVRDKAEADLDAFAARLYAASRAENPAVRQQELAARIAALSVDSARASFFPTISASASIKGGAPDLSSDLVYTKSFGLTASIPLFPLSDRFASVKSAQADTAAAGAALKAAEEDLLLSIYTTTLSALSAAGQIESADATLAFAEQNHRLALERFRLSAGTLSSLADAEASLAGARAQATASRFDLYAALTALVRLSGAETEAEFRDALR